MTEAPADAAVQSDGSVGSPPPSFPPPLDHAKAFAAACCTTGRAGTGSPHEGRRTSELHAAYLDWAAAERLESPLTLIQFAKQLTALGYPRKSHGVREGLRLKEVMTDGPADVGNAVAGGAHPHHAPRLHLVDPPEPTPEQIAEYVVGRDEAEALAYTPEIDPANPEPPADLSPAAGEVFRSTVAEFGPEGSPTWDRASLQALSLACRNLDTAHRAAAEIAAKGVEMESPRGIVARPSVAIQDKATARYMAIMKTLGVTR